MGIFVDTNEYKSNNEYHYGEKEEKNNDNKEENNIYEKILKTMNNSHNKFNIDMITNNTYVYVYKGKTKPIPIPQ